jgi:hypothetical protein
LAYSQANPAFLIKDKAAHISPASPAKKNFCRHSYPSYFWTGKVAPGGYAGDDFETRTGVNPGPGTIDLNPFRLSPLDKHKLILPGIIPAIAILRILFFEAVFGGANSTGSLGIFGGQNARRKQKSKSYDRRK